MRQREEHDENDGGKKIEDLRRNCRDKAAAAADNENENELEAFAYEGG